MKPRPLTLSAMGLLMLSSIYGCRQAQERLALYTDPRHRFACQAPARWRSVEGQGGSHIVSFYGPPAGPRRFSTMIGVFWHGGTETIGSYVLSQRASGGPSRLEPLALPRVQGFRLAQEAAETGLAETREESILIPAPNGFWALVYSAPKESFEDSRSLFLAAARSL